MTNIAKCTFKYNDLYFLISLETDMEAGVVEKLIDDAINEQASDVSESKKSLADFR